MDRARGDGLSARQCAGFAAVTYLLWLYPSVNQLEKYLPPARCIGALAFVACAFFAAFLLLRRLRRLEAGQTGNIVLAALVVVMGVLLWKGYALAHSGTIGGGDDRGDALRVGIQAMLHGHYPYYQKTFLGMPLTPMPGALLLDTPWYLAGAFWLQNLFWVSVFAFYLRTSLRDDVLAFFAFCILVLFCLGSLRDYIAGGDYLVNALYVLMSMHLVAWACRKGSNTQLLLTGAWLGLTLCSRPIYACVILPICIARIFQGRGRAAAAKWFAVVVGVVAAVVLPFLLYDPRHFTPLTSMSDHLNGVPTWLHPTAILAVLGILAACRAFTVSLTGEREAESMEGIAAVAFGVIFVPYSLYFALRFGWHWTTLYQWAYGLPVTLFGGLALLRRFQRIRNNGSYGADVPSALGA